MTKKSVRRFLGAALIIASLVVAAIPTETKAIADEAVKTDFEISGNILLKYTGTAETVSVPDGIEIIAEEAFADNSYIKKLKLPSSLEQINYAAFSNCSSLSEVTIPDSVTSIGTAAFTNCSSLKSFSLGANTKDLGTGVFVGCSALSSVTGNNYFSFSNGVLYDDEFKVIYQVLENAKVCKNASSNDYVTMTSYSMPDTVTDIKPYAFYGCKNITDITFSNNLSEIPAYSFSYCNGLKTLKIPYSVNSIDVKAFQYCVNLEDVEIPVSVSFIHKTAFDGCSKLNIVSPEDSYAYNWFLTFDKTPVNIVDTEDNSQEKSSISENDSSVLKPIEGLIGETVIVGRQAVFFIDSSDFSVTESSPQANEYNLAVNLIDDALLTETNGKGLSLPKFTVIDDRISGKAFYGESDLTEYEIEESITSIGDFAFARSGLQSISIPDGVTHIGYGAFYHCEDLSEISVSGTVTEIEPSAFADTAFIKNWKNNGDSDFLILGDGILVAYKGYSTKVTVPETVKKIGPEAFKNHTEITEVYIPDSVTEVGEEAFYGCINLNTVSGGMNLKSVNDRAFYSCPVNTVRIPENVKEIGLEAFDLSLSTLSEAYRTAVFQGTSLPKLTYEKTSTRLTNSSYREDALNGIKVAIVEDENIDRTGTILDRNVSGFSGLICVISSENNEYFNGTLKIIDCTLTAEEASEFIPDETVYIYGKGYNFDTDELNSVLNMAKEGAYNDKEASLSTVSFTGSDEKYVLNVTNDDTVNSDISNAYKRIYGDTLPGNLMTFQISLREEGNEIPLTKFGKQTMNITMDLPDNIPSSNLHVICTDEDGQLEDLSFSVLNDDGKFKVSFDISHTGNYGLYSFNSTEVSLYELDESPDTGDYIHPKWFLSVGLLSFGLILLLLKSKKESQA